jgi:hypothetical protein
MKKIIGGQTYNTDTATPVARWSYVNHLGHHVDAVIHQARGGALFSVNTHKVDRNGKTTERVEVELISRDDLRQIAKRPAIEVLDKRALLPWEFLTASGLSSMALGRLADARLERGRHAQIHGLVGKFGPFRVR